MSSSGRPAAGERGNTLDESGRATAGISESQSDELDRPPTGRLGIRRCARPRPSPVT